MVNAMAWYLSKSLDGPNAIIHAGTQLRVKYKIDELTVVNPSIMAMDQIEDLAHFEILNETEAKLYTWSQENTLTLAHANDYVAHLIACIGTCNRIITAYAEKVEQYPVRVFFGVTMGDIHALKGALLDEFEEKVPMLSRRESLLGMAFTGYAT